MTAPRPTVQHVLQAAHMPPATHPHVLKVCHQLMQCRTPQNGYHLYRCANAECAALKYQYHSCHNRHCPQCGAFQKDAWMEARRLELLPITYYHVVFTLPHQLHSLILGNRKELLGLLFDAASQTLLTFAHDPQYLGATPGIVAVLHSWGQQLSFHPHLHCIVSGGGIQQQQDALQWVQATKNDWRFLFPVKALNKVFRAKYLTGIKRLAAQGRLAVPPNLGLQPLIDDLFQTNWVVYAKAPFGGPEQVIEYLGRYTHKVAISNHRLQHIDTLQHTVTFRYKDYAQNGAQKTMTLPIDEFARRFTQHILPAYFTKIRSYGYLANRYRSTRINTIITAMQLPAHPAPVKIPWQLRLMAQYGIHPLQCPVCRQHTLKLIAQSFAGCNHPPPT